MEEQSVDEEELWSGLEKAMKGACEQFVQTKTTEGENLKKDTILNGRIAKIAQPENDELLLTIKPAKGQVRLVISASASLPLIYLSREERLIFSSGMKI